MKKIKKTSKDGAFRLDARRLFGGVKHDALALAHMQTKRSFHTNSVTCMYTDADCLIFINSPKCLNDFVLRYVLCFK